MLLPSHILAIRSKYVLFDGGINMLDDLNIDQIINTDDKDLPEALDIPKVSTPEAPVPVESGLKIKKDTRIVEEENEEKSIESTHLSGDFWDYKYEEVPEKEKKKNKRISFLISLLVVLFVAGIVIYLFNTKKEAERIDITNYAKSSDSDLEKTLGLSLHANKLYTSRTRVLSDAIVTAKADNGFAVIYINDKQEGIFFDTDNYSLYGLSVGESCDESFQNVTFDYDEVYKDEVSMSFRKRNFYYLYNTTTGECMIISIYDKSGKIKELGFYKNYKKVLYNVLP